MRSTYASGPKIHVHGRINMWIHFLNLDKFVDYVIAIATVRNPLVTTRTSTAVFGFGFSLLSHYWLDSVITLVHYLHTIRAHAANRNIRGTSPVTGDQTSPP